MKKLSLLIILCIISSCQVEDDFVPKAPAPANLIFPDNNHECTEGIAVQGTNRTEVVFTWENDILADGYTLVLKDLSTQTERLFKSNVNEATVELEKATAYSWYVISHNIYNLETVQSDIWKFFNAGDPVTSYTPFPADAVFPEHAGTYMNLTSLRLQWNGLDIDNDISSYDVYFDTTKEFTTPISNTIHNTMDITVTPGSVYYWRIVTNDAEGNTSQSEIFEFKIE